MAEVVAEVAPASSPVSPPPADLQVLSTRRFEVAPPENLVQDLQAPHETFATTKEEEWVTKKKKELTTTRQIETRIQRQVVLEDGKVVEDSGPLVTSNTTEDTETQDSQTTEHRTTEGPPSQLALEGPGDGGDAPREKREVRQHTVTSRQQTDERVETEQVTHNGDFSDEAFQAAVQASLLDLRAALRSPELQALTPAVTQPKIVHQSTRTSKVVDTEDSVETSQVQPDGRVVTETRRTQEHEEVAEHSEPEDEADGGAGGGGKENEQAGLSLTADDHESVREASHHFRKTKDQQFVEYLADGVKVGEEMRFEAETAEGERRGDAGLLDRDWDSLSARMRRMRREGGSRNSPHTRAPPQATGIDRKDALTKKPLDLEEEEETRKVETSKWLEHHFGSDSRSSRGSLEDEADAPTSPPYNSFINVTMKSRPIAKTTVAASPSPTPLVNGAATSVAAPKYVTSASRVFVSSPEPDEPPPPPPPANGYFQGVTEWSERNHCTTTRELDASTHRPDRVQVLPTGPHHTFTPKHLSYSEKTAVFKTSSGGANSRSSPYPSSLACPDRSLSYTNGSPGRTSPAVAPAMPVDSHNSQSTHEHRREYEYHRAHSPYNDRNSPYMHQSGRTPPLIANGRDAPGVIGGTARDEDGLLRTSRRPRSPPRTPSRSPSRNHRYGQRREREGEDSLDGYRGSGGGGGVRWEREWERERGRGRGEPRPDYSPARISISPSASPSPSPPPSPSASPSPERTSGGRRVYRRPRVDLDLPSAASPPPPQPPPPEKKHGGIGESFRRLVGRFRASSAERKRRKAAAQAATAAAAAASAGSGRRSPSPHQRRGARGVSDRERGGRGGDDDMEGDRGPVAPPRSHRANKEQQRSSRTASSHTQLNHHSDGHAGNGINMHGGGGGGGQAQQRRFYLGEDPFGGSIYGREREYDGVKPVRRTRGGQRHGQRRASREEDDMNRANVSVTSSNSLGRLSKSTSRLASGGALGGGMTGRASPLHAPVTDYTRNAQTLPRKLYDEHSSRLKRQVYQQQQLQRNAQSSSSQSNKALSHSMINVSIINNVTPPHSGTFTKVTNGVHGSTGPAKPARTYRTNLSRSKSFNVHTLGDPVDTSSPFVPKNESSGLNKSTSHLHRLDESPPPLKSPSILASISRSQRDLSANESFEKEDSFASRVRYEPPKFSSSASNLLSNGYAAAPSPITTSANTTATHEAKKRLFMRELMERAPELYRTLKNNSDDEAENRTRSPPVTSPSPTGRIYGNVPLKNGTSGLTNGILDYSNSFRSSSTAGTPDRGFRSPLAKTRVERVTSPALSKSSLGSVGGAAPALARRGSSSNDDYSETVRITSKSDDPLHPSVTNTVQSFSKKTVPTKGGVSTETIESTETTTVTKSRSRPSFGGDGYRYLENGIGSSTKYASPLRNGGTTLNGGSGGVVIEVRPSRK